MPSVGASDNPVHPPAPVSNRPGSVCLLVPTGCPFCWCHSLCSTAGIDFPWFIPCWCFLAVGPSHPKVDAWQGRCPPRGIHPEEAGTSDPSAATLPSLPSLAYLCAILFSPTVLCLHAVALRRDEVQSPHVCFVPPSQGGVLSMTWPGPAYSAWVLLSWSDRTGHLHAEPRRLTPPGDGLTPWQSLEEGFFCSELCDDFTKTTKGGTTVHNGVNAV